MRCPSLYNFSIYFELLRYVEMNWFSNPRNRGGQTDRRAHSLYIFSIRTEKMC